jgi:hypothetical protein
MQFLPRHSFDLAEKLLERMDGLEAIRGAAIRRLHDDARGVIDNLTMTLVSLHLVSLEPNQRLSLPLTVSLRPGWQFNQGPHHVFNPRDGSKPFNLNLNLNPNPNLNVTS